MFTCLFLAIADKSRLSSFACVLEFAKRRSITDTKLRCALGGRCSPRPEKATQIVPVCRYMGHLKSKSIFHRFASHEFYVGYAIGLVDAGTQGRDCPISHGRVIVGRDDGATTVNPAIVQVGADASWLSLFQNARQAYSEHRGHATRLPQLAMPKNLSPFLVC
jgi:hypothetical protein